MTKKIIKLSEGDLHKIVKESAQKILNEAYGTMPLSDFQKNVDIDTNDEDGISLYITLYSYFKQFFWEVSYGDFGYWRSWLYWIAHCF